MEDVSQRINDLINTLSVNRVDLVKMLEDITQFRSKLEVLLPKDMKDFRNRHLMEERMKTVTNIINTELQIRKQVDTSIRDEIGLLTKTDLEGQEDQNARDTIEALALLLAKDKKLQKEIEEE